MATRSSKPPAKTRPAEKALKRKTAAKVAQAKVEHPTVSEEARPAEAVRQEAKPAEAKPVAAKPAEEKPVAASPKKPARNKAPAAKTPAAAPSKPSPVEPSPVKASPPKPDQKPKVLVNAVAPEEKLADFPVDTLIDTIGKSLEAAMPAARAVNRKLVDIAQANMNAGLELARDLAGAKSPMEAARLQMAYWQEHAGIFQSQAEELRMLSAELLTSASAPIRAQLRRG